MSEQLVQLRSIQPEHRIFWIARASKELPDCVAVLKKFFYRYANRHLRSLPWRHKKITPFQLLVAELLLVQTKAEDVAKVWPGLIVRYPSAAKLARAQIGYLTRLLRPLGLQNQRSRAVKAVSKAVVERFAGRVPRSIKELLSLPHVGLYVACAVACFKFDQAVPIVDANVIRVLGRITGDEAGKELRRSKKVWEVAWKILPKKNFVLHNYGLLDFAAQVCQARSPQCTSCPLNKTCAYGSKMRIAAGWQSPDEGKRPWNI